MFAILFSGKFETPDYEKFMTGLKQLVKETDTKIYGDFKYQQFVEFEEIEDSDVEVLESDVKTEDNKITDISDRN